MNHIRHLTYIVGGLTLSMLAMGAPALAIQVPAPGTFGDPPITPPHIVETHLVTVGGMPGWQITLIAAGAAVLAAAAAVILDRASNGRRNTPAHTT